MEYKNILSTAKLILELQAPALEDCYQEGFAYAVNGCLEDNPYLEGTANFNHWNDGWWAGFYNEDTVESHQDDLRAREASNDCDISANVNRKIDIRSKISSNFSEF